MGQAGQNSYDALRQNVSKLFKLEIIHDGEYYHLYIHPEGERLDQARTLIIRKSQLQFIRSFPALSNSAKKLLSILFES